MENEPPLGAFRRHVESELRNNILPFWMKHAPDPEFGGFRGRIWNDLRIDPQAEKGIILNSRILWTFSRAFTWYAEPPFLELARRAFAFIKERFFDQEFRGVFWTVDYLGQPLDTKKRTYGQAFVLYALSEYYYATRSEEVLNAALDIFNLIESRTQDLKYGGYFETYNRDWTLAADQRLSDVDQDDKKSMNTHLHVLEAYARLAQVIDSGVAEDIGVKLALRKVIALFTDQIIDRRTSHFGLFFDEDWRMKSNHRSFGHDIEGSWLLVEAAETVGDRELVSRIKTLSPAMADAVYTEALDDDGALLYEADPSGIIDYDKHWWPQAEAVVGFLNAYEITGRRKFLDAAIRCWDFINSSIIDQTNGEWYWKVSRAGEPDHSKPKIDQWKCPYHNSRMCFEVLERLKSIEGVH